MSWKETLRASATRADELREYMDLTDSQIEHLNRILHQFSITVTRYYLSLVSWDDPARDPMFRMCIPSVSETDLSGDFDTSGEVDNTVVSGLQHKYPRIALILSAHHCTTYCEHYFRKRLADISDDKTADSVAGMAAYVDTYSETSNVLIPGEDTFINSNQVIAQYLEHFTPIPHLDLIRFGTRTPVVLPERIYDDHKLLDILRTYTQKKQIYVVTQFNHPKELTGHARKAVKTLLDAGVIIKNQTVLLKGINDNSHILGALLKNLTKCGAVPYYVFQCRPVSRVKSQFQAPLVQGYEIAESTENMQSGQGRCIRCAMSHATGKIEILEPVSQNGILFKYHRAKYTKDYDRIFTGEMTPGQAWLEKSAG